MARAFGRVLVRIWDDEDFLAPKPQQLRPCCFLRLTARKGAKV